MDATRFLLLDINGLLCCKLSKDETPDETLELLELKAYKVIMRPGAREFLEFCYKNFTVGFFSSTTYPNANAILEKLLTSEQKSATAFRWYRDRTHLDPNYGKDSSTTQYDTIKKLSDVFDSPTINADRKYHTGNTILCDDSTTKTRFNNPRNVLMFEPFKGDASDKVLLGMMESLEKKFEELNSVDEITNALSHLDVL